MRKLVRKPSSIFPPWLLSGQFSDVTQTTFTELTMPDFFTTREVAELLGTWTWRIRRLFEDGTLPEPARFGGKRAIPKAALPAIVDALRARGWLAPADTPATGTEVPGE